MLRAIVAVLLLSACSALCPAPLTGLRRASNSALQMKLNPDDFVPSEEWYREYLGQEGLRYSMGKAPQEIEAEGDYGFWEAMFGQTSNNAAKKKLKEEARASAYKNKDPETSSFWLKKYGHPRFFPAYIDKSGESDPETAVGTAGTLVDINKATGGPDQTPKATKSFGMGTSSFAFLPGQNKPAGKSPTKVAGDNVPQVSPMPNLGASADSAKSAAKEAPTAAKSAARVVAAKVTDAASSAAAAAPRVRSTTPKPKGNAANLPTRKSK